MKPILRTEKLCKTFSNEGLQQHVIKNLDLEIMEKDFTVIMGSSGSGKSTLLYALSGMDKPSLGKVFFGEEDISDYSNDKLALFRRNHPLWLSLLSSKPTGSRSCINSKATL